MKSSRNLELKISNFFHHDTIPVLISPAMLRKYDAGQIDVAYFRGNKLYLVEVKSSKYPKSKQVKRLKCSAEYLSCVFNCETLLLTYNAKKNHLSLL